MIDPRVMAEEIENQIEEAAQMGEPPSFALERHQADWLVQFLRSSTLLNAAPELLRLREFRAKVEEAEGRVCPEDYGFEEYIRLLLAKLALAAEDSMGDDEQRDILREVVAAEEDFRNSTGMRCNDRLSAAVERARQWITNAPPAKITQKPGELATAKADTLGSGLTGRRDAHGCCHPWRGAGPAPRRWTCCGVIVYRSYEDYVDD